MIGCTDRSKPPMSSAGLAGSVERMRPECGFPGPELRRRTLHATACRGGRAYAPGMSDDLYDELSKLPSDALMVRHKENDRAWERWDRKSDPVGEYTARQTALEGENAVIERILRERAAGDASGATAE